MTKKVRTRFAPSPTGNLHVGGARTALFNWLYAKNTGGEFILRIEDTDFDRSAERFTNQILSALSWLSMDWDEGPEVGGPHAPYQQSQRLERYQEVVESLMDKGVVYPCYCTDEELQAERERQKSRREPPRYSGRCRNLDNAEIKKFEEQGRSFAYRYQIPDKPATVEDVAKGTVNFPPDQVGDFIVVKSNGYPAYNFAVVVDDHDMEITDVLRGDDHLSNTPRQLYLYEELGWEPPRWCHLPMILGDDGERLSKRHGATDVESYREQGFLPEAIINALVLLGWSTPDGVEVKKIGELINDFTLSRINRSASRFDYDKVKYFNSQHLRSLPAEELASRLQPFLPEEMLSEDLDNLEQIIEVFREQLVLLSDFSELYREYFSNQFSPQKSALELVNNNPQGAKIIREFLTNLEGIDDFNLTNITEAIKNTAQQVDQKGAKLYKPMRVAVTGQLEGPEFHTLMVPLGKKRCLDRIQTVLQELEDD